MLVRVGVQVMNMLDRLYQAFDVAARSFDVFKVETIGDAYMAVANLVSEQSDHTKRIAEFAIDVRFLMSLLDICCLSTSNYDALVITNCKQ